MKFKLGCNYWASNAGTDMWKNWSEEAVREDLKVLSGHGVEVMRVFPNWKDFQPVIPMLSGGGYLYEYRLEGERFPENPYWLDGVMLERFSKFCDICEEFNIKLIVGLITGWMSGRLFIPTILNGKDLYQDPEALLFEQRFVKGMVENFKDKKAIYAWDLGNECNCMYPASDRNVAASWTAIIANAIRANDPTRPVVSGMHTIGTTDNGVVWTINDQAEYCDILTTHPYPVFVEHAYKDNMISYRTLMHATCETKYYANIGKRPCLVEEVGTLGPTTCSDEKAADFMRANLFSNWANGALGVMWWCANDFTHLKNAPYTWKNAEVELGMMRCDRTPKPVLEETKRVSDILKSFDFQLPAPIEDACCVLTKGQKQWGAAYMTYCLARQAGMNISFAYAGDALPDSDCYILPSVCGYDIMAREKFLELKQRVADGATLYLSVDNAMIAEFEELFGMKIEETKIINESLSVEFDGSVIDFTRQKRIELSPKNAEVLANDSLGFPVICKNAYGKGRVYLVNFPAETMLLDENDAFDSDLCRIYKKIFAEKINSHPIVCENKYTAMTLHPDKDGTSFCVIVNYSAEERKLGLKLKDGYEISEVIYGDTECLKACEAAVFKIRKKL